jgi:hypothetical protein
MTPQKKSLIFPYGRASDNSMFRQELFRIQSPKH